MSSNQPLDAPTPPQAARAPHILRAHGEEIPAGLPVLFEREDSRLLPSLVRAHADPVDKDFAGIVGRNPQFRAD